jgi:hypothetical protein
MKLLTLLWATAFPGSRLSGQGFRGQGLWRLRLSTPASYTSGSGCLRCLAVIGLIVALVSGTARAASEPVQLSDFAYGVDLMVSGDTSIYELRLPAEVYLAARHAGLADLAVFDAAGRPVPFGIVSPANSSQPTNWQPLPVYGLEMPVSGSENAGITLRRTKSGRIEIAGDKAANATTERQYIIDRSKMTGNMSSLKLKWALMRENFVRRIAIDSSDSLNTWKPLLESATIASLRQGRDRLSHDEITIAASAHKYLRVRFLAAPATGPAPRISSVQYRASPPQWTPVVHEVALEPVPGKDHEGGFELTLPRAIKMARVQIELPESRPYLRVAVWRRDSARKEWAYGSETALYRLKAGEAILSDNGIAVRESLRRLWSIAPVRPEHALVEMPKVSVRWRPHLLVFVANGTQPHVLAYGSATATAVPRDARRILREVKMKRRLLAGSFGLRQADLGPQRDLAGPSALKLPFWQGEGRKWLLWGVLIAAVIVLLTMAVKLLRESRDPESTTGSTSESTGETSGDKIA